MTVRRKINVCQLIDSSDPGGAEKLAFLYFRMFSDEFNSYLCVTRKEGVLSNDILNKSHYLFLDRSNENSLKSIFKFYKWIYKNEIDIIHAHLNSVFLAVAVSFLPPFPKVIWHGHSSPIRSMTFNNLHYIKKRISKVLCVNEVLKKWVIGQLKINEDKVLYVPNFSVLFESSDKIIETNLIGKKEGRIICLANIHEFKDQQNLIQAFELLHNENKYKECVLIIAGFYEKNDPYFQMLQNMIIEKKLEAFVQFTGTVNNVKKLLSEVSIAVLSSKTEGFPLAILEYGLARLPVVSTNVGQIVEILDYGEAGVLVEKENCDALYTGLKYIIDNPKNASLLINNLSDRINQFYSQKRIYEMIKSVYIKTSELP